MLSLLKRYRETLLVGALLVYPFLAFLSSGGRERETFVLDRLVVALSSPLQAGLTWTVDGVGALWSGYVGLWGVRAQNEALLGENAALRRQLNALTEARAENERLKKLLGYSEANPAVEVPARVIGINPTATVLSVRIDRGEDDGIAKGMPVVTADGVVGQILRTTAGYADVMLITDVNSKIGVRVQDRRSHATASGASQSLRVDSAPLRLENAKRTEEFNDGEVIVTAGTDGVFPPGIVVGRIQNLQKKTYGLFQTAQIVPAVDLTRLEEVLVIATSPALLELTTLQSRQGGGAR